MGEDNIWLAGRRQELRRPRPDHPHPQETTRLADGTVQAVRGAGVEARTEAITGKEDNT